MLDLNDVWAQKWHEKRLDLLCNKFNVQNVISAQYSCKITPTYKTNCRDLEMMSLQNSDSFIPNLSEDGDDLSVAAVLSCKFCPLSGFENTVVSVTDLGYVYVMKSANHKPETLITKAHNNAVFDFAWVPGEKKILTLSGDLTARLWDVGQESMRLISVFVGHRRSVKSADFVPDNSAIFATGSRDGNIHIWDARAVSTSQNQYKPDQTITLAAQPQPKSRVQRRSTASVTALVFQDSQNLLCGGPTNECVRIWDMRKTHCAWRGTEPKGYLRTGKCGITDLKLNKDRTKLYTSCINSNILSFNLNSSNETPIAEFTGHECKTFYIRICVSEDGAYLASGSRDSKIYVWKTTNAELQGCPRDYMFYLSGHEGEVTGIDYKQATGMMVSCGEDGTVKTWAPKAAMSEDCPKLIEKSLTMNKKQEPISRLLLKSNGTVNYSSERGAGTDSQDYPLTSTSQGEITPPRKAVQTFELSTSLKRKLHETSPVRTTSSDSKRTVLSPNKSNYRSPTLNLPNYVLEGPGSCRSCPSLKQKENKNNWLIEMRERSAGKKSISAEKSGKRQRTPNGHRSSRKTLLEYYKTCSKTVDNDHEN